MQKQTITCNQNKDTSNANSNKNNHFLLKSRSKTRIRKFVPLNQQQQQKFLTSRNKRQNLKNQSERYNTLRNSCQSIKLNRKSSKKKLLSPQKQMLQQWQNKQIEVLKKYNVQFMPIEPCDNQNSLNQETTEKQRQTAKRVKNKDNKKDNQKQTVKKFNIDIILNNNQDNIKTGNHQKSPSKESKVQNIQAQFMWIDISQIQNKQSQKDAFENKKLCQSFLGNSILQLVNNMSKPVNKQFPKQNTQKFLDLIALQTQDLKKVFNNRQKKKKHEIERLKRIFPQDFFKK